MKQIHWKKLLCFLVLGVVLLASFDAEAQRRRGKSKRSSKGRKGQTEKPLQFGGTLAYQLGGPANALNVGYAFGGLGFTVGGFGQYRLSELFALTGELKYSYHTFTGAMSVETDSTGFPIGDMSGGGLLTYKQHAIAIPIMAKLNPIKWLYIEAGIEPRFNLGKASGKTKSVMGVQLGDNLSSEIKSNFFELAVGGGIGLEFGHFFVGNRVMYGVTSYGTLPAKAGSMSIGNAPAVTSVEGHNLYYNFYIGLKF
ncbi:MAG: PorT family protein [Bacteroidales bacterium]|jgi:hypothetical protein|nr:PorT family protein [Bacteroidales bacterium]